MSDSITVIGNIATPPERKITANGLTITTFRLASSGRRFDRQTNAWVDDDPNWYSVSSFRVLAENAFYSLHKGERVIVTGKLRLKEWDTGTKRGWTAEIDAESLGHDLLFGTTRFDKTPKRPGDQVETSPTDDGWAVQGPAEGSYDAEAGAQTTSADDAARHPADVESTDTDDDDDDRERTLALVGNETPF